MKRKIMERLNAWRKEEKKRPLVLTGTRQAGKTWLLRDFGQHSFRHLAYFHLETDQGLRAYFEQEKEPAHLLEYLETQAQVPVLPGSTLVILDELQACPAAREALGGFAAEFPEYAVAAAERTPGPYPLPPLAPADAQVERLLVMDFEEFLWACREVALAREIREHFAELRPMEKKAHQQALRLFRLYLAAGGFPGAVEHYRQERSLLGIPDIHSKIRQLDLADISCAASGEIRGAARSSYLSIPQQLEKENPCFQYRVARKGSTRGMLDNGIRWLSGQGMALLQPERTGMPQGETQRADKDREWAACSGEQNTLPKRFRLYARDAGLCTAGLEIPAASLLRLERSLAVQRVVENALAVGFAQNGYHIASWSSGNKASLPFLLERDGEETVVDLHFEERKKSRSLFEYRKQGGNPARAYRVSEENFRRTEDYDQVPYYAAFCI